MRKVQNDCFGCATPSYPCMGEACPNRHVVHFYCDICKFDIDPDDGVFDVDGKDLCLDCLKDKYRKEFD